MPLKNWLVLNVPVATNNGKPIVRQVRTEIVVDERGIKSQPLSADERVMSYETALRDKSQASLTVREKSYGRQNSRYRQPNGNSPLASKVNNTAQYKLGQAAKIFIFTPASSPATFTSLSIRQKTLLSSV